MSRMGWNNLQGLECHYGSSVVLGQGGLSRSVAPHELWCLVSQQPTCHCLTCTAAFGDWQDKLKELGGNYTAGPDFHPHALSDGRLVTGQNPCE